MARPRKFDEQKVLDAARDQFWTMGYAGTRIDEIAETTGLGKGSLYGAFGNKQALFRRVFDEYCTVIVESSRQRLSGTDEEAFERLSAYVRRIAENTAADAGHRGCLLAKGAAELSEHDEVITGRSRETIETLQALLRENIAACQRNGDIDSAADPDKLSAVMLGVVRGIEAVGKAGAPGKTLHDMADASLAVLTGTLPQ
jgi:AcrR family transcriptional regulator